MAPLKEKIADMIIRSSDSLQFENVLLIVLDSADPAGPDVLAPLLMDTQQS